MWANAAVTIEHEDWLVRIIEQALPAALRPPPPFEVCAFGALGVAHLASGNWILLFGH